MRHCSRRLRETRSTRILSATEASPHFYRSPYMIAGNRTKQQGTVRKGRAVEAPGMAGVVGMGLMGTSITACLLGAGHRVACIEVDPVKLRSAPDRLKRILDDAHGKGLFA